MTTYVFREIRIKDKVKTPCIGCGKKLTRTVDAMQTVNPFNLNVKGIPKSEREIRAELPAQLAKEKAFAIVNAKCKACRNA